MERRRVTGVDTTARHLLVSKDFFDSPRQGAGSMTKYVYSFGAGRAEGSSLMRNLLGGKGCELAEMTNLGIPVPPGFTITTQAWARYTPGARPLPDGPWEPAPAGARTPRHTHRQGARERADGQALPPRPEGAAPPRDQCRSPLLVRPEGNPVPADQRHPRRLSHRRHRHGHGLPQPRRDVRHRRRLHARSAHG